ncbi:CCA tRNA nucleotidyltransferase [Clostridium sp. 19966]|uniref:CCA tRNA nucleotidyltransferase n=1 Tax=Clostridium sp. 19966 TaxID=2768166 RepID=UPI0028DE0E7C|nr:CCA tRNA nucleotidyltransferase [Clostridium sp. 19966]MDT8718834.1 CCA tRNA nucleotidyltransferase [Clostridium sp. 19966]
MKINLPQEVNFIIEELNKSGFEAFAVGGCVRDSIIGRVPSDWDITTSALPENIISIFPHTVPTGLQHGTVTVIINKNNYEVTTYRIDGKYTDNRHPDEVLFTKNLSEDLSRRDFTINALAYNNEAGLVDLFNGQDCLKNKMVKTVGDANDRFNEDALRMIRAIRFACQLDFSIDKETFEAIFKNHKLIENVSIERIRDEFSKILVSNNPDAGIENLRITGLLKYFLPEAIDMVGFDQKNPHHDKDIYTHTLQVIKNAEPVLITRLAALFHDIGKPASFTMDEKGIGHFYGHENSGAEICETVLKRMKFDNYTIKTVCLLVSNHMTMFYKLKESGVKKLINKMGKENMGTLFNLQTADIKSSAPPFNFSPIDYLRNTTDEVLKKALPICLKDLKINGADLIRLGFKPGKELGDALNAILDMVLEKPDLNDKAKLIEIATKLLTSKS